MPSDDEAYDEAVCSVLAGSASYDSLAPAQQRVVRAIWDDRIARALPALNLAEEFEAAGVTDYVESDESGQLLWRGPKHRD